MEMMKNEFPDVYYIRTKKNIGTAARNKGMQLASGQIVITIDDDISGIDDRNINELVNIFERKPNLGALNFKVLDKVTGMICNWSHHCHPDEYCEKEFLTYEITEGAVAFRKAVLEKAGYYPDFFFLSHEGPDLAFRILNYNYTVIYSPKISVLHSHSDSGRMNWFNYYYDTRNQFWLATRNFPMGHGIKYLARGLTATFIYSVRDNYFKFWVKAVIDGLKGMGNALSQRKVVKPNTMELIRSIDKKRPTISYYIKLRLFKKGMRL
jgi:GT2 family glycosyltransferase